MQRTIKKTNIFVGSNYLKSTDLMDEVIRFESASIFQKDILVLNGIDLVVKPGEFVYFIGKTGSGKSSLLRTIYADLPLRAGQGWVAGYDLTLLRKRQVPYLRRKIGIVFQDFQLLPDRTVAENLLFVMKATGWKDKNQMRRSIDELLTKTGIPTKGFKMPHQLSGGEQQRVGVARALINRPEILIADEPTGNLDPESSDGILNLIQEINRSGTTVIMATHNYRLIHDFPGRVVRLEQGKLYETPQIDEENIRENPESFESEA